MQTLKFTIEGSYWDTQIYNGRLYLFSRDGSIQTLDWDRVNEFVKIPERSKLAFDIAFQKSSIIYDYTNNCIVSDNEIRGVLENKFRALKLCDDLKLSRAGINSLLIKEQDNVFPFPHIDSDIYKNRLYVASKSGVFKSGCSKANVLPVSKRLEKLWDCPSTSISANYGNLAIAAGDQGVFELEIEKSDYFGWNRFPTPFQVSGLHCSEVEWSYYSIFCSSHVSNGYLAYQRQQPTDQVSVNDDSMTSIRIIKSGQLFDHEGYTWGTKDKIYQARNNGIHIKTFDPFKLSDEPFFEARTFIPFQAWKGDLVSAKVASFGTILELDNALVVIKSDGSIDTIEGEPIHWRIFPRSTNYENHLHIIYEDRMEIHSYNHELFVDQKQKSAGYRREVGHNIRKGKR